MHHGRIKRENRLPKIKSVLLRCCARALFFAVLLVILLMPHHTAAQTAPDLPVYTRKNTFGFFTAYSNDSSHIIMGYAQKRKLFDVGATYGRRLYLNHIVNWQYNAEILPVALESDPQGLLVTDQLTPSKHTYTQKVGPPILCSPSTTGYSVKLSNGVIYSGTQTLSCHGREWNIGEAFSPVGMQWNFRPTHALQPYIVGHGGYMYSTHAIPIDGAGAFNFTFDLGAGLELWRAKGQSVRVDWRYHHISNHYTAQFNPGIDNGIFQVTYAFGR